MKRRNMTNPQSQVRNNECAHVEFIGVINDVLTGGGIDCDLADVAGLGGGNYSVKLYIEHYGAGFFTGYKSEFRAFLEEVLEHINNNPLLCPLCGAKNPSDKCDSCHAAFKRSLVQTTSGLSDNLPCYSGFEKFAEEIERKSDVDYGVVKDFCEFEGELGKIFDGCGVIYDGISQFPIFVTAQKIKLKEITEIDDENLSKLLLAIFLDESPSYCLECVSADHGERKTVVSGDTDFDCPFLLTFNASGELQIALRGHPDYYIYAFYPDMSVDDSDDFIEAFDNAVLDKISDEAYLDGCHWVLFNLPKLHKKETIQETVDEWSKHIESECQKAGQSMKCALDEALAAVISKIHTKRLRALLRKFLMQCLPK